MQIDPKTGLIKPASFFQSPFYSERSAPHDISLLVIHCISFSHTQTHDLFMGIENPQLKNHFDNLKDQFPDGIPQVSAHIFVPRETKEIIQYVSLAKKAWHAGQSEFEGRAGCNDFSIGIELEGDGDVMPYTTSQYKRLAELTIAIMKAYPEITPRRITGHSNIARPLGRKQDPGILFDWPLYFRLIQAT